MPKRLRQMSESELSRCMTAAGNAVKHATPPGSVFALLVFDDACVPQYISSANQSDMILALRAAADRLERREAAERVAFNPFN